LFRANARGLFCLIPAYFVAACGGNGDGGGGNVVPPNRGPVIVSQNADISVFFGRNFSYDASKGGSVFSDPDGDPLTITVTATRLPQGVEVAGTLIRGRPTEVGRYNVAVDARDPDGATTRDVFLLTVDENPAPVVARPNGFRFVSLNAPIDIDPTQNGGVVFSDGNDPAYALQIDVQIVGPAHGLAVRGIRIQGQMAEYGMVRAVVTATDPSGAQASDVVSIVAAAIASDVPEIPYPAYQYADSELNLAPYEFGQIIDGVLRVFGDRTPRENVTTDEGALLGRVLFYDQRLSITNTASCGSCHFQSHGFAGADRFGVGFNGESTRRNVMTLTNVRFNLADRYFSDMRAFTLENLVVMPIQDTAELGQPLDMLVDKLAATDFYAGLFYNAFGTTDITPELISRALAQFVRSIMSYRSKYDLAFFGDPSGDVRLEDIFTPSEYRGSLIYTAQKCDLCHGTAIHVQQNAPQNNGLDLDPTDGVSGLAPGAFRVGTLRNIAVTAPYMHDGRFATLREVIDFYDSDIQPALGLSSPLFTSSPTGEKIPVRMNLSEQDKLDLEAFLRTLTDDALLADPKFSDPFP
jgi:cytochrome c peroxidase